MDMTLEEIMHETKRTRFARLFIFVCQHLELSTDFEEIYKQYSSYFGILVLVAPKHHSN